ncbi:MAG: Hpt domain-containing protein [Gammaproteobacteria bacterium]|nr:Hpt domain-containing protein [Gammaproteobacteria bacterium]
MDMRRRMVLDAKVQLLKESFCRSLRERQVQIDEQWQLCSRQESDPASAFELYRLVHSLAGAAPSFGFDALGQRAREVEILMKVDKQAHLANYPYAQHAKMEVLMRAMFAEMEQTASMADG